MNRFRKIVAIAAASLAGVGAFGAQADASDPFPPYITPTATWLSTVNYYRSMAGLPAVTENTTMSQGAYNHSCYMLYNGIAHDEIPGRPGYTTNGDNAGNKGNVAVSSVFESPARYFVELWMTGPFHAIGVLRHNLKTVGWGRCANEATSPWKSAATLNIIDGLDRNVARPASPIVFPGNGTTTSLYRFITESPNPVSMCNWTGSAGLPLLAMMPEPVTSASVSLTGPSGPVQTCRLFGGNTTGVASDILKSENAVVVMPRTELQPGRYTASVTTNARTVTWSFTVDPNAATGIMPIPVAEPTGPASGFNPVTPFRYADSRTPLRITKLLARTPKQIAVAGIAGIPTDTTALSANFTVTSPSGAGFLTVYNCTTPRPTASTLNFASGETVANAAVAPLNAGNLCVYSPVDTHLIIDINGYFRPASSNKVVAIDQVPVVDTVQSIAVSGRRAAASVFGVRVRGGNATLPDTASTAVLNVTAVNAASGGYVTLYPCDTARPTVSTLNVPKGATRQNLAIVPISATGEICVYTHSEMDIRVDLVGYFAADGLAEVTPTQPTRVIDTRDTLRPLMNFNMGGMPVPAGASRAVVLRGDRGIPANAQALSLNVTVVPGTSSGTLTVFACGSTVSVVSMTFTAGRNSATAMLVRLPASGDICVRSTAPVHVVFDVNSFWA
ncbi:MAG: CAP domain-containing protein [Ilumatobacteraceae bacterium]